MALCLLVEHKNSIVDLHSAHKHQKMPRRVRKKMPLIFTRATLYASAGTSCGPVSVRLSVCVTSRCSIKTVGLIDLVFGTAASFDQSYNAL